MNKQFNERIKRFYQAKYWIYFDRVRAGENVLSLVEEYVFWVLPERTKFLTFVEQNPQYLVLMYVANFYLNISKWLAVRNNRLTWEIVWATYVFGREISTVFIPILIQNLRILWKKVWTRIINLKYEIVLNLCTIAFTVKCKLSFHSFQCFVDRVLVKRDLILDSI